MRPGISSGLHGGALPPGNILTTSSSNVKGDILPLTEIALFQLIPVVYIALNIWFSLRRLDSIEYQCSNSGS